jgi:hypothetical protein
VSTRRGTRNTKRFDPPGTSAGLASCGGLKTRVTVLAIEQALAELGIHARLGDIVAKARSIENGNIQSRSRRKPEHLC